MKKELENQLLMLEGLLGTKDHPAYIQLVAQLKEVDKHKQKDWNKPEVHEKAKEAKLYN